MKTRDYLEVSGLTKDELAEVLSLKSASMITRKMDVEMPKRWARLLDERDGTTTAVDDPVSDDEARAHIPPLEDALEGDAFRANDGDPRKPEPKDIVGPGAIKLTTVQGYIEAIYGGAAQIAQSRGDGLAADVIRRYSPEFSEAWITYIQSDPRIMKYLEKMMIGTPLGNLIGVHAIAIGSYVFARAAARQLAAQFAHDASDTETADGFMGVPES